VTEGVATAPPGQPQEGLMTPAQINRRRALAVVAAVPAATALGGAAFPTDEPGELAALVRR
jgi:hypothetical protein